MSDQPANLPFRSILTINFSEDQLKGYVQFLVPTKANLTAGDIMDMLNSEGVKYGVDQAAIERVVLAYKENPQANINKNFMVVKGLPMQPGKDGYVEFYINEQPPVSIDENGKADFRNIEKFKTVEKGKILAKVFPMIKGKNGIDIFGESIKAPEVKDANIRAGENVTFDPRTGNMIANITGIYHKIRNTISVSETLLVSGNVGLESGNLSYTGVIKIAGNIEHGAEVTASGDIFVGGLIESGKIRSQGTLNVRGGINTKHEDCLNIKNGINSTYIENSNIESEGDIVVISSVVGSNILTSGNLRTVKEGSKIAGGEITVLESIYADNIGTPSETPTTINIGINPYVEKDYKKLIELAQEQEETLKASVEKISQIKDYIQRMRGNISNDKKLAFKAEFDAYKETDAALKESKVKIEQLKKIRFCEKDAIISVKQTIYPGVTIRYYGFAEKIESEYKHCTFRFSKTEGKMHVETYQEFKGEDDEPHEPMA